MDLTASDTAALADRGDVGKEDLNAGLFDECSAFSYSDVKIIHTTINPHASPTSPSVCAPCVGSLVPVYSVPAALSFLHSFREITEAAVCTLNFTGKLTLTNRLAGELTASLTQRSHVDGSSATL